jgi:DNA-binding transcriptional LysR family regulator
MTPSISTHSALAQELFQTHGVAPAKLIEADNEAVISSLVIAGLGVALMREDLALEAAADGTVCVWRDVRATTTLQFLHLNERADDPVVRALADLVAHVWSPASAEHNSPRVAA